MSNPQNINQTVNYQEGSVVSKEIISQPSGTVTLFAFDQGQGLSEHTAPFDALAIITDGTANVTIGGVDHSVKSNEMILLPANVAHALKAVESFKMILTMIR